MRSERKHKDVEFHVLDRVFGTFDEAAGVAVMAALESDKVDVDVVVWSAKGAEWLGGDDAREQYEEDSEASVFERIVISANSLGRVP